jgi:ankyrin repeat protein
LFIAGGGKYGSALQAACARGALGIVKALLDKGTDPNVQCKQVSLPEGCISHIPFSAGGKYGTALQAVCFKGHFNITALLLNRGANPNLEGT